MIEINDTRLLKEFKSVTFSGYKRSDVKKHLLTQLFNANLEQSLNWTAELICCGAFMELWEIILLFLSKYIHLGNPKIPIYIELRFNNFKHIVTNGYIGNELQLRNNNKIRSLFCEVICTLSQSSKRHGFDIIKINKNDDYQLNKLNSRLTAPNTSFASKIFRPDDNKEIFIAINELGYNLSDAKNIVNACFWIEWIIEYESICKLDKRKLECEYRENIKIDQKFAKDSIWMIWELIFNSCPTELTKKITQSLHTLFSLHYSPSCKKKRRFILYFAVSILIDNYNPSCEIISSATKDIIDKSAKNIDDIYKQIKKSEKTPKTDYLFNGIEHKTNVEKTFEKLEVLNTINSSEKKTITFS
jgi:hypothetical protein|uniref:Uncharacterized protein n=1 Tax=viral metagenome TaxID=1070528 RepID=A0A6C0BWS6_9ZZZZ